jgi:hypothetical protein
VTREDHNTMSDDNRSRLAGLIEKQIDLDALLQMLPEIDLGEKPIGDGPIGETG